MHNAMLFHSDLHEYGTACVGKIGGGLTRGVFPVGWERGVVTRTA